MANTPTDGPFATTLDCYIVESSLPHTHSIILLHGLGSNGEAFGKEFLDKAISSNSEKLLDIFPGAKFIFPTSKRRRSSAFRRSVLTQWFDISSLDDPSYRRDNQIQGLQESFREIQSIMKAERQVVPADNIILGGISQGCAMGLMTLLAINFPLGGFVGMSGWLPFRNDMNGFLTSALGGDFEDGDPFEPSSNEKDDQESPLENVLNYTRDLLSLNNSSELDRPESAISTPIF